MRGLLPSATPSTPGAGPYDGLVAAQSNWQAPSSDSTWVLRERRSSHAREPAVETRFSVGNGLVGIRGGREEDPAPAHPRMLVAGLFDIIPGVTPIPGLVPAPEWLGLRITSDGTPLQPGLEELIGRTRTLDMRSGTMWHEWEYEDAAGRRIQVRTIRLASLARRSIALHLVQVAADHRASVTIHEPANHPAILLNHAMPLGPCTVWETWQRKRRLAISSAELLFASSPFRSTTLDEERPALRLLELEPGKPATMARIAAIVRDPALDPPCAEAQAALQQAYEAGIEELFAEHAREWERRWQASDVQVAGDDADQRALRFAAYHLISAANPDDSTVSVGARGLTGEAYFGHVFWDTDIFMLPFYTLTWPEAARAMLMYRYRGLDAARQKAMRFGYRGALYAWEAAENGEEATPDLVYGPTGAPIVIKTGTEEHHISADVAYGVWRYWEATGDDAFFREAGAEIILETARFWASRASLGPDGRYHILRVIGPDEYHEDVDDNAYTNILARWNVRRGLEVARLMRRRWPDVWRTLAGRLGITASELKTWRSVAAGLAINEDPKTGVIEQFAGYFDLDPINLADYEPRTQPMDVLLGHEAVQRLQVIKQPDVLMAMALLWDQFPARQRLANFRYYETRCGHGSSLSPAVHALLAARLGDLPLAERYFRQAAAIDLDDAMGNAAGGIHMATQGGLWQAGVFGYGGLRPWRDGLQLDPHLPAHWHGLTFRVQWRGRVVQFSVDRTSAAITACLESGAPLVIRVGRRTQQLEAGTAWTIRTRSRGQTRRERSHDDASSS